MKSEPDRQKRDSVQLRCEPEVANLVRAAAHRELCGEGEFLRQACIDAMKELGMEVVDPDPPNFHAVKRIIFHCRKWFRDQLRVAATQAGKPSESEFIRAAAIERAGKLGIRVSDFEVPQKRRRGSRLAHQPEAAEPSAKRPRGRPKKDAHE